MLIKKNIIFSILCVILLILICGFVCANVLSARSLTSNEIMSQNFQEIVDTHCKDLSDINATFFDSNSNKCIAEYGNTNVKMEPSSLFKYITFGIALNENLIESDDVYECTSKTTIADTYFRCYEKSGHGKVSFSKGVWKSCPISYIEIARKIDNSTFYDYIDKLGFDISSHYDKNSFDDKDKIAIAIGQGMQITPQELLLAYDKMLNSTDVFSSTSINKLLECMKESNTDDSTIMFGGVCPMSSGHVSAVISITFEGEKQMLGMVFSNNLKKREISNIVKRILNN